MALYFPQAWIAHTVSEPLAIIGVGGFGREVLVHLRDLLRATGKSEREGQIVFLEPDNEHKPRREMGAEVLPQSAFDPAKRLVICAIGTPQVRAKVIAEYPAETRHATLIHPTAVLSDDLQFGPGLIICTHSVVTCNVQLGAFVHLNLSTQIGHDCLLGDYFTTAPLAAVSGNVTAGHRVYLGTQSGVRQGVSLADDVVVGMGAAVVSSLREAGVYTGVPARLMA